MLALRLPPALRSEIESWAKQQNDKPSRSEAIRRLIEFVSLAKLKDKIPATNRHQRHCSGPSR